jgi:long-chain-fatty-acid--[acyl-carrier-protein] ligase
MLDSVLRLIFRALLSLRYRIRIVGLEQLAAKDERGMLFLPNHPALIDPLILLCFLTAKFPVRALAGRGQIEQPGIRWLASRVGVRKIPDSHEQGSGARHRVASTLRETVRALNGGEALVFYPAGRVYRRKVEDLGSNGGAAFLLRSCPSVRIVLVRTTGLWGSSFGRATGQAPTIGLAIRRGVIGLLKSGILFAPRRRVTLEFSECLDFPRQADHEQVNRFLEAHYNAVSLPNTYVPYSLWERGGTRALPEPSDAKLAPASASLG